MQEWIDILAETLDAARAIEFVTDGAAGGIDVFLGTTCAETNPQHQALLALDYETYREMAVEQMKKLASRAGDAGPSRRLRY